MFSSYLINVLLIDMLRMFNKLIKQRPLWSNLCVLCANLKTSCLSRKARGEMDKYELLPSPIKSLKDNKDYKVIKLNNGLTACLISDLNCSEFYPVVVEDDASDDEDDDEIDTEEESEADCYESESSPEQEIEDDRENVTDVKQPEAKEKMAAAALCVGVGSFSDPMNIPGMAHFLEHMVFMGSAKFPKENDFDSFITKRGGSDNASTDTETTTFYFECLEKYLFRSLDKFAQFFIDPLMKKESMTREREAIDSEFQMAITKDGFRKEQLLNNLFNTDVPINKFAWGNLATLKDNISDDDLYRALHEFRKRHYSAHRMTLCIQARLPMDTLIQYVLDCFSKVKSNNLPPIDHKQYSDKIYDNPAFNKIYYVSPVKNVMKLEITWIMPPLLEKYKTKPHQYVSWLLGHEGKGSLISHLRKKVWALYIFTGNAESGSEFNSMYSYFTLTMGLTQSGVENVNEIISMIYSYISLLREQGVQERIFNEIQLIEKTSFDFADDSDPIDVVESLVENMHFYASEDYITGSDLFFQYNPQDICMVLNCLRPDNMNVILFLKNAPNNVVYDMEENWFKTSYTIQDIPESCMETWSNMHVLPEFFLPEPNKFLTKNFDILPFPKENPQNPDKIVDNDYVQLWFKFDKKFNLPMAYIYYYMINPLGYASATNAVMLDMFLSLLEMHLKEDAYPAELAGLNHAFGIHDRGCFIKLNGYNENLDKLLELITQCLLKVSSLTTNDMFDAVKQNMSMLYYNRFHKPAALNKDIRLSLLLTSFWTSLEKHSAISHVTLDMLKEFSTKYIKDLYIQGLIQGNITEETAKSITQKFINSLGCQPIKYSTVPKIEVSELPTYKAHCCRVRSFNKDEPNSYITNYYQDGIYDSKTNSIIEMMMLIMEEPLFDTLRTKEQLGYHVSCSIRDTIGILGYTITINAQAEKFTTHFIDERIEVFIKQIKNLLRKLNDKKLDKYKQDLIKIKQIEDVLLKQEVDRNWTEILNEEYVFDRRLRDIQTIQELKLNDLRTFWDDHNMFSKSKKFKKLSIQIVGNDSSDSNTKKDKDEKNIDITKTFELDLIGSPEKWKEKQEDDYFITNINDFKESLSKFNIKK